MRLAFAAVAGRDASLVGVLLDRRYVVTSLLARGGMATVYRGTDTRLDRPVAIKVLHPQYAADRSWAERFEREARAAANLHHPNVVAVYDHGVDYTGDQAHPFLVMELIDGGTLRDLLDRGVVEPALALSIIDPVLCALAVAHQSGLVHRDIKPENVLIGHGPGPRPPNGAGTVKVADFGLVRAIASSGTTSASVILGTVAYLSPEQVETGKATPQSDVYSAGLLLHEMLTGKPAFTGDTALSVAYQHVNSDVPAPSASNPDIPAELDHLVVRATSRDQSQRPADAAAFLTGLRHTRTALGLAPVPVPALPPPDQGRHDPDLTIPAMNPIAPAGRPATRALNHRPATQALHIDDDTDQPPPRRTGRRAALWALAVLLLAGLAAGAALLFLEADKVTVPNVAGADQTRAEEMLRTAELSPDVKKEPHNSVAAGTAIGTEPPAGTELRKGDTISLVISLGRPKVPDIAPGTPRAEAEAAIKKVQLKPRHDAQADAYHDTIAKGAVITVTPEPGTPRRIGATVTIALSKGPPPTPVPDVTGKSKKDAFQQLRGAGFEPYEAGEEFNANIDKGKVTRTDPATGATPTGDKPRIGVYTSNAITVPEVRYKQLREAERILAALGLSAKTVEGGAFGRSVVVAQQPAPGTRVKPGTAVELRSFP